MCTFSLSIPTSETIFFVCSFAQQAEQPIYWLKAEFHCKPLTFQVVNLVNLEHFYARSGYRPQCFRSAALAGGNSDVTYLDV
eukprot:1143375-Pelagomonas_calceolata.AAC.1